MKKTMMLSICACLSLYLPVQSAYMFYDEQANTMTQSNHLSDQILQTTPAQNIPSSMLLTAGDDSTVKIVFIEPTPGQNPSKPFMVTYETIHPKVQTFNTLKEAQDFALNFLKETTKAQLQREQQEQQRAAQKQRQEQQARAFSNPYLTGGKRKKRQYNVGKTR